MKKELEFCPPHPQPPLDLPLIALCLESHTQGKREKG